MLKYITTILFILVGCSKFAKINQDDIIGVYVRELKNSCTLSNPINVYKAKFGLLLNNSSCLPFVLVRWKCDDKNICYIPQIYDTKDRLATDLNYGFLIVSVYTARNIHSIYDHKVYFVNSSLGFNIICLDIHEYINLVEFVSGFGVTDNGDFLRHDSINVIRSFYVKDYNSHVMQLSLLNDMYVGGDHFFVKFLIRRVDSIEHTLVESYELKTDEAIFIEVCHHDK